ncbi:MAG TPA: phytoene desaturase family protein [Myxococcota bacterium]|nr:phytoene desaturase family protein [Myxococcota bacterium]
MRSERVIVVGAGVGGLVAALELAARGLEVVLVERAAKPGGKMREARIGDDRIDVGPTVLTMRWVFDELFERVGATFDEAVGLRPVEILARHAWSETERLDLFPQIERTADAVGSLAGAREARGYRLFCEQARRIYDTLERPFLRASRPGPLDLVRSAGWRGMADLWSIQPFSPMQRALGRYFEDPRLRQLFGRYATYVGSSPFSAPATLMLIAHVEREGVWLVEGGMQRVADALARLAEERGARLRYRSEASEVISERGRAKGVVLSTGERIEADAVVVNADPAALAEGRFGLAAKRAVARVSPSRRSLSALTWAFTAEAEGFPLLRHSIFFSRDSRSEFEDLFERARMPADPTVYVCAQDREGSDRSRPPGPERLFCLVNAPARGDAHPFTHSEIERCTERMFARLAGCGLKVDRSPTETRVTTPTDFDRLFPATGGALYGTVSHGWRASFRRPGARTRLPGLYLAGGSTHPGAGVPMAALSGRMAAAAILSDLASTARSRTTATSGGTSTP